MQSFREANLLLSFYFYIIINVKIKKTPKTRLSDFSASQILINELTLRSSTYPYTSLWMVSIHLQSKPALDRISELTRTIERQIVYIKLLPRTHICKTLVCQFLSFLLQSNIFNNKKWKTTCSLWNQYSN